MDHNNTNNNNELDQNYTPPAQSQSKNKRHKTNTSKQENETRSLAQASRTLKACELCRKQKTRCFRVPEDLNKCLRCKFLSKKCSFENDNDLPPPNNTVLNNSEDKLNQIHQGINEILSILKNNKEDSNSDARLLIETVQSMQNSIDEVSQTLNFENPMNRFLTSPFSIVNNQLKDQNDELIPDQISNLNFKCAPDPINGYKPTIANLGIFNNFEIMNLIDDFRRNYGRWVSFPPGVTTNILFSDMIDKCPLLLTSCILISYKYSIFDPDREFETDEKIKYLKMIRQLILDLDDSLLKYSSFKDNENGFLEFLQSMVILSIYSTSISSTVSAIMNKYEIDEFSEKDKQMFQNFNLDPWMLSCNGLTTFITKSTFGRLKNREPLIMLRIYNHLCLVHLINSIFTGRMSILDENKIKDCSSALSLLNATNFDGRMVSEIGILFITYKYIQSNSNETSVEKLKRNFISVMNEISQWYETWEYLLNQPALQFIEFNYNICMMLIQYIYSFKLSSIKNETDKSLDFENLSFVLNSCDFKMLQKMFEHASAAISHINNIQNDSYFAYLSDQLHFCFYFAAIFTCSLLKHILDPNTNLQQAFNRDLLAQAEANIKSVIAKFCLINRVNFGLFYKYGVSLEDFMNKFSLNI
ncbi:unnamed protein product [Candida verbasci]|uniref:Zn(2)-C6 fungal-type domain-containing protein n=1 Tax=Candida verbasci TaxID=1227364 RepID=A0A9W4XJA1_9ASCO|nr:unnamed protein product [Candida verbasci]